MRCESIKYIKALIIIIVSSHICLSATPDYFKNLQTTKLESSPYLEWTNFGPGMSGYCDELFVHPTDPNSMYLNLDMGNSYYTHDAMQNWVTMQDWDDDGEGGRPTWMDFSNQNPDFGLALDEKGKVKETNDRGRTWTPIADFGNKHSVIAVDPNDDNNWYVGAGQFWRVKFIHRNLDSINGTKFRNTQYGHVRISKDKGKTWTIVKDIFDPNMDVAKIFVDPNNGQIVYLYSNYGFYKSVNGGLNWTKNGSGLPHNRPRDGDWYYDKVSGKFTLYLLEQSHYSDNGNGSISTQGGVYKSSDQGETWVNVTGNLPIDMTKINDYSTDVSYYKSLGYWFGMSAAAAKTKFAIKPISVLTVFNRLVVNKTKMGVFYLSHNVKHDYSWGPGDVWRTNDDGKTWKVVGRNGAYWAQNTDQSYWASRKNSLGVNMTYAHLDKEVRENIGSPAIRMLTTNSRGEMYTVSEQQILRSTDDGENWYQVDDDETSPGSGIWVGRGGSNLPGEAIQLETGMSRYLWGSGEHGLWISAPGGQSVKPNGVAVEQLTGQSIKSYDATSISAIAVHPKDTNKIYIQMFRQSERGYIRRSTDGGKIWNNIAYPLKSSTDNSPEENKIMQADLQFRKDSSNYLYFTVPKARWVPYTATLWERNGPSDFNEFGIWRSKDEGFTWERINNGLPANGSVYRLTMDPNNNRTFYASLNRVNYTGETKVDGGLYKSTNGGDSWVPVVIPEGIQSVNHLSIDSLSGAMYLSAGEYDGAIDNGGVWLSHDAGSSWTKIFFMPHVMECYPSPVNSKMIWVVVGRAKSVANRNTGVFYTKDNGSTWIKGNFRLGQPSRIRALRPDLRDENVVWTALKGSGWYKGVISNKQVRALATSQYLFEGETTRLDASFSIGTKLKYQWVVPSIFSMASTNIANPTFTAPSVSADTLFKVLLVVSNEISQDTLQVNIYVRNIVGNLPTQIQDAPLSHFVEGPVRVYDLLGRPISVFKTLQASTKELKAGTYIFVQKQKSHTVKQIRAIQ